MMSRIASKPVGPLPGRLIVIAVVGFLMIFQWSCAGAGDKPAAQNSTVATNTTAQNNDDPKGLKKAAKSVVDNLVAENYDAVVKEFNEKMKQAVTADKLKADWTATTKKYGACKSQGSPTLTHTAQLDSVVIKCQMENGSVNVEVAYDDAVKVSGLWLHPVG